MLSQRASLSMSSVYELARIMGTSVQMIERSYGALIDTAKDSLLSRLDSYGALEGHEQNAANAANPHE